MISMTTGGSVGDGRGQEDSAGGAEPESDQSPSSGFAGLPCTHTRCIFMFNEDFL